MNLFNIFKNEKPPAKGFLYSERTKTNVSDFMGKEIVTPDKAMFGSLLNYLPDPDEILSATGQPFEIYRKIMTDAQIRACCVSRKAGTKGLDWEINRGKEKTEITRLIEKFYNNFEGLEEFNDAILNAPLFGFQPIEIIWDKVGEYILPVALKAKNQEWFMFGKEGDLRFVSLTNLLEGEKIPDRKFLIPSYHDINNKFYNPYGDRVLSSCFWPVTFKRTSFKWWVTFVEKYGMPYLIGKMDRSASPKDREDMLDSLKAMVQDAIAVIDDENSIDFINANGNSSNSASSQTYQMMIDQCNQEISKAILGQTLTTDGAQKGSGSYAVGKVHATIRKDIILSDKKLVEGTHNQLIKWITEINFGNVEIHPKFGLYLREDVDKERAERDALLTSKVGIKFKKAYFEKNYGLDKTDFEIEDISKKESFDTRKPDPSEVGKSDKVAEKNGEFSEQLEDYTDKIVTQFKDEQLKSHMKNVLSPVFKAINNCQTYNEVTTILDTIKPEMNTYEIEQNLTKIIWISSILGSVDVRDEE